MRGGGKDAHVGAGFGDDHIGDQGRDPGDGDQLFPGRTKGLHQRLDPPGEGLGGRSVCVDLLQIQLGQELVVSLEPSGERLDEGRDLCFEPATGQGVRTCGSRSPSMRASSEPLAAKPENWSVET